MIDNNLNPFALIFENLNDLKKDIDAFKKEFTEKNEQSKLEGTEPKLFTRQEVANIFSVSLVTLRDWEKNKIIPPPIRKGSRVYWRAADIYADINQKGGKNGK